MNTSLNKLPCRNQTKTLLGIETLPPIGGVRNLPLSRNQTKTLLGIETYLSEVEMAIATSRNQTKTLLGIETKIWRL